jgi:hypothetical protein
MQRAYRMLLRLYPRDYQGEFAEEMATVFTQAEMARRGEGWFAYTRFLLDELIGALCGAVKEHVRQHVNEESQGLRVASVAGGIGLAALLHITLYSSAVAALREITAAGQAVISSEDPRAAVLMVGVCAFTTLLCLLPSLLLLSMRLVRRQR